MSLIPYLSGSRNTQKLKKCLVRSIDALLIVSSAFIASFPLSSKAGYLVEIGAFVAIAVALILLSIFHSSRPWCGDSKLRVIGYAGFAWAISQSCALAVTFALHRAAQVERPWWACWALIAGAGLLAFRLILLAAPRWVCWGERTQHAVAIVGAGKHCDSLIRKVLESPDSGFRPVAIFNAHALEESNITGLQMYRDMATFASRVRAGHIREVWLALPMSEERMVARVVDEFKDDLVNVRLIPDVRGLATFGGGVVNLDGTPAINLMASPLPSFALLQKAIFDRVFAAFALIALLPLMGIIAVAVKLSSKGPVLFTQRRKGVDGAVFLIFKFRTMRVHVEETGVVRQAERKDPRVTRVGSFLRRTSLDELPQFLNVLRGEMSIVGPRPHAIEHDGQYQKIVAGYIHRYRIKPGITGWAQINGFRGETDLIEKMVGRVEHDLYYMMNWSFRLDMRIVIETVIKGLVHRNAY
jgi:Undecaprenyl-phosphate glucose phosphotransferase